MSSHAKPSAYTPTIKGPQKERDRDILKHRESIKETSRAGARQTDWDGRQRARAGEVLTERR